MRRVSVALLVLWVVGSPAAPALGGKADVVAAKVQCRPAPGGRAASVCKFSVSVRHADAGWDHYANRYQIVKPDGKVLATRLLRHPHVEEQPFTRGLGNVRIPHEVATVDVRAGDLVHGLGGATVSVEIPHAKRAPTVDGAGEDGAEDGEEESGAPGA
jgi:hypothetical protein